VSNLVIASFPHVVVEQARQTNTLTYWNNYDYDYTFGKFAVIPYCLGRWVNEGLQLDEDFVHELWADHADKRPGHEEGEKGRARKLALDAFRAVYDMASISTYASVQVRYSATDDMAGRDMQLMIPDRPTWVQLFVNLSGRNYQPVKRMRRQGRNEGGEHAFDLCAGPNDVDYSHQPYVPVREWYASVVDRVVNYVDPECPW
jgi:hypothetical protein